MVLTREQRECVDNWVRFKDYRICPFAEIVYPHSCDGLCAKMFPHLELRRVDGKKHCPCHCYPVTYVIKVAKKYLARKEQK